MSDGIVPHPYRNLSAEQIVLLLFFLREWRRSNSQRLSQVVAIQDHGRRLQRRHFRLTIATAMAETFCERRCRRPHAHAVLLSWAKRAMVRASRAMLNSSSSATNSSSVHDISLGAACGDRSRRRLGACNRLVARSRSQVSKSERSQCRALVGPPNCSGLGKPCRRM